MKLIIRLILGSFLFPFYMSCNAPSQNSDDKTVTDENDSTMEMMEYVTSKKDTIMIPRNVADYNRFLADSLEYRDNIVTELCAMLESKPEESFVYSFGNSDRVIVNTKMSSDSIMRFYVLNNAIYKLNDIIVQYKNSKGIHTDLFMSIALDNDECVGINDVLYSYINDIGEGYGTGCSARIDNIHTIHDDNGCTYYLVIFIWGYGSWDRTYDAELLRMNDGRPKMVPLFNTGKKHIGGINTYMAFNDNEPWREEDSIYVYNEKTKDLYIPLLSYSQTKGKKYIIYHFDGTEFKYSGIR